MGVIRCYTGKIQYSMRLSVLVKLLRDSKKLSILSNGATDQPLLGLIILLRQLSNVSNLSNLSNSCIYTGLNVSMKHSCFTQDSFLESTLLLSIYWYCKVYSFIYTFTLCLSSVSYTNLWEIVLTRALFLTLEAPCVQKLPREINYHVY